MSISIRRSLQGVLGFLALLIAGCVYGGVEALRQQISVMETLNTEHVKPLALLKDISDAYAVTIVDTTHKAASGAMDPVEAERRITAAVAGIRDAWARYEARAVRAETAGIVTEYRKLMELSAPFIIRLGKAIQGGKPDAIQRLAAKELYPAIDPLTEKIDQLIKLELKEVDEQIAAAARSGARARLQSLLAGAAALVTVIVGFLYTARSVIAPLMRIRGAMVRLAGGDVAIDLPDAGKGNEIGEMAQAVATFRENARERQRLENQTRSERALEIERQKTIDELIVRFRAGIREIRATLDNELDTMRASATSLGEIAQLAALGANSARDASGEAFTNVNVVAGAAGELTSASREISTQVHKASEYVSQAMTVAQSTNEDVASLAALADRIGDVVSLINSIAEQTNLLALNATIEAARAGDAGRGFAVVASEVKTLAGQTAKATEEISTQIAAIQAAMQQAVTSIQTITTAVSEIEGRTMAIAAAVEQQEASTLEISRSIELASDGSEQVARNVSEVTGTIDRTHQEARRLSETISLLAQVAGEMSHSVEEFLVTVSADVSERRSASRRQLRQAVIVLSNGRRDVTQLHDISEQGVRIDLVSGLAVGEKVQVEWKTGTVTSGKVVWIENKQAGIAFDARVAPDALMIAA